MKKILIAILSTLFSVMVFAQNQAPKNYQTYLVMGSKDANIEIIEANGVSLKHRVWGPSQERKFSLRAYAKIARDKWTTVKFKIKYTGKTPVYFVFGGEGESAGEKTLRDCVLYDNVKIDGKLIAEGDFEKVKFTNWKFGVNAQATARVINVSEKIALGNSAIGNRVALSNSHARVSTELQLEKDKVVEVSFDALSVDLEEMGDGDIPLNIRKFANMGFADENAGDGIGGWMDEGKKKSFKQRRI